VFEGQRAVLTGESFEDLLDLSQIRARPVELAGAFARPRRIGSLSHESQRGSGFLEALEVLGFVGSRSPLDQGSQSRKALNDLRLDDRRNAQNPAGQTENGDDQAKPKPTNGIDNSPRVRALALNGLT